MKSEESEQCQESRSHWKLLPTSPRSQLCKSKNQYYLVYKLLQAAKTEYHRWGGLNNRKKIFVHSSGACKSKIKKLAGLVSSETALRACRWQPSPHVLTWLFLNGISLTLGLSPFPYKEAGPVELEPPPLWPHLTAITSLKVQSTNTVTLDVRPQPMNFYLFIFLVRWVEWREAWFIPMMFSVTNGPHKGNKLLALTSKLNFIFLCFFQTVKFIQTSVVTFIGFLKTIHSLLKHDFLLESYEYSIENGYYILKSQKRKWCFGLYFPFSSIYIMICVLISTIENNNIGNKFI